MSLLLDTHALVWWVTNDDQLSQKASAGIQSSSKVFYSLISFWEICVKVRKKNHNLPFHISQLPSLRSEFKKDGFQELPIEADHCLKGSMLPNHHRDPWDRLIIGTAQTENLTIVTKDSLFDTYDVRLLW